MKKILSLGLALLMLLSFAACKGAESNDTSTPAKAILAQFKTITADEKDAEAVAQKLSESSDIFGEMMMASMPVEEGNLNGFSAEIKGFSKGAMFGPAIGTIPFVGYVFETEDADALKAALKESADLRWNICTEADEMLCESEGNLVLFVMAPASFDADDNAEGGEAEPELPEIPEGLAPAVDDAAAADGAGIVVE